MKLNLKISCIIFFVGLTFLSQAKNLTYPSKKEINKRINYLQRVINQPLESNSEIMKLGLQNPEFMLFTYAFSSYALTNLAIKDSCYKTQAIQIIKESITKVLELKISRSYGIEKPLEVLDSIPNYSVLYLGHVNLMIGCFRLLSTDSTFNSLNDNISKSLFTRYNQTSFLNLESYTSSIWIPDNTVALASLKLHSVNAKNNYDSVCKKWVQYAKKNYLDKKTGVLFSTINSKTGKPIEEPRGSMIGWSIMFIYQFDPDFAIDLYFNYKKHFSKNYLVFRLFRERYNNS